MRRPGSTTVLETLDGVLDALARYSGRDATIEELELKITIDRNRLLDADDPRPLPPAAPDPPPPVH